jgi:PTH1 family peptidyl-tRNA hydrolase
VPSPIKLIVGLGNPGAEHTETRHNVGFWFVDTLAEKYSLKFRPESKFQSEVCRISTPDIDCWLCKPMTYMNVSGQAVQAIANFYKIAIEEILVVHDEIDLDAGTVRLKKEGGHGGHNGLRDIIEKMNSKNFIRLRIGVSHPGSKEHVTPHVLGRPSAEDQKLINETINSAIDIMPQVFDGEIQKAMTALHTVQHKPNAE